MSNLEYKAAYTPAQLAVENKKLNIPIYQRLFVWEEEQIELLLDDLNNISGNNSPYYIGSITVVEKDGKWDIVDGQQRLTFLSLFGAYCCSNNHQSVWKNFLYTGNDELRINYIGRAEDKDDLKKIAQGGADVVNRNFRIFLECIKKKFHDPISENFAAYVYHHASFLITELPADYAPQDLNLFFEKMNATGKQLTAVEQIKGKYFPAHAAEFDDCLNFKEKQSGCSQRMSLWYILNRTPITAVKEENNTMRYSDFTSRSILTPEVFLLHCLEILTGETVLHDERKILETFKNNMFSPRDLLSTMKNYRQWIDANIIYLRESSDGSWEYAFRSEDNKEKEYEDKAKNESDSDVNLRLKMKQFQSMLYVSSSNYQEWVLEAYRSCVRGNVFSLELLTSLDQELHKNDSPVMTYPTINRYWFWKLDYLLWEKFMDHKGELENHNLSKDEKDAIRNYKFRRNRSIEHLHPQTDGDIIEWKDAKHYFGNLAMISSSFNSSQQNDSVGIKFQRLKEVQLRNNNLESIKMLLMFKLAGGQESGWTVDVMKKHQGEMFGILGVEDSSTSKESIK